MVQENHTTDNYFAGLAPWGVNVATDWPTQANPPGKDQPHDRRAYGAWLKGHREGNPHPVRHPRGAALLRLVGAERGVPGEPLLRLRDQLHPEPPAAGRWADPDAAQPPRNQPAPVWDMPSLPGHAQDHGLSWRCYTASNDYPVGFYTQLKGSPNLVPSTRFVADAQAGALPQLCYLWHNSPEDEHPSADVTVGMGAVQHGGRRRRQGWRLGGDGVPADLG